MWKSSLAVTTDKIADGAVTEEKLSSDVQQVLDNAVTMTGAGNDKVLGTDNNGAKIWYDIVF